jgi:hypothetical protein
MATAADEAASAESALMARRTTRSAAVVLPCSRSSRADRMVVSMP